MFPFASTESGTCAYCGSEGQALLNPAELTELFVTVAGLYEEADDGKPLSHWFQTDWAMFDHPVMDEAHIKEILADILDDGDLVRRDLSPIAKYTSDSLERWRSFRVELKHVNRFFPTSGIDLDRLQELLDHLLLAAEEVPATWYRARIHRGDEPYLPKQMGAPPKERASHGRANPAGIPYLYLASTATTAIAELRPHTGESATVADFALVADRKILDLAQPRRTVSPFVFSDVGAVGQLRADIGFLEQLGDELTRPVLPTAVAVDYTPSQYLCEFVKKCGFHGLRYASAVGSDLNLALFDPRDAQVGSVAAHRVTRVTVAHETS